MIAWLRSIFGPCFLAPHDFGPWKESDHIHFQKGEREEDCFSGRLRACARKGCGAEDFEGPLVAVKCGLVKNKAPFHVNK